MCDYSFWGDSQFYPVYLWLRLGVFYNIKNPRIWITTSFKSGVSLKTWVYAVFNIFVLYFQTDSNSQMLYDKVFYWLPEHS